MGTTTRKSPSFSWERAERAAGIEARVLRRLARRIGPAALRLAVGSTVVSASDGSPAATVRFRDLRTLLALAKHRRKESSSIA